MNAVGLMSLSNKVLLDHDDKEGKKEEKKNIESKSNKYNNKNTHSYM